MQCRQCRMQSWATNLLLGNWSCNGRTFHLAFTVHYDPQVIFKIKKHTFSLVRPPLLNFHPWMYLLSELWVLFLVVAITCLPCQQQEVCSVVPCSPFTELMHRFLAPVLSAQTITAPTGRRGEIPEFCSGRPTMFSLRYLQCQKGPS